MENLKMGDKQLMRQIEKYLCGDLGAFYTHTANRLMLYPLMFSFFLIECLLFWLFYQGPSFFLNHMAFTTVYSLHKGAVYTICMFFADIMAHRLFPSWGAYGNRTVGRQWLIWSSGLAVGFVLQRTMIRSLIVFYAPDVIAYFMKHPQGKLNTSMLLLILIPYWVVVMVLTMKIAMSKQRIQKQNCSFTDISEDSRSGEAAVGNTENVPMDGLQLAGRNGKAPIALCDITHVTVEDHYCRINYSTGNGLKSKMIRLSLKEMLPKLPQEHFMQIHRSHVVNVGYISRLAKTRRDHKVVLQPFDVELPVSRSRFKDLLPRLKVAGVRT